MTQKFYNHFSDTPSDTDADLATSSDSPVKGARKLRDPARKSRNAKVCTNKSEEAVQRRLSRAQDKLYFMLKKFDMYANVNVRSMSFLEMRTRLVTFTCRKCNHEIESTVDDFNKSRGKTKCPNCGRAGQKLRGDNLKKRIDFFIRSDEMGMEITQMNELTKPICMVSRNTGEVFTQVRNGNLETYNFGRTGDCRHARYVEDGDGFCFVWLGETPPETLHPEALDMIETLSPRITEYTKVSGEKELIESLVKAGKKVVNTRHNPQWISQNEYIWGVLESPEMDEYLAEAEKAILELYSD